MTDPHMHYLGVPGNAQPYVLLGLSPVEARDPVRIQAALRKRLADVYQHPDRKTGDINVALRSLRNAAASLLEQIRQRDPLPQPNRWHLTDFDRNVLAILVGYGGWNAQSRARLVALALSQGVTVTGLMKVIQGLGEYAKSGGPALPVSEMRPTAAATNTSKSWLLSEALAERFFPEFKEESTRTTIKLSVFFGLLTLLMGILALRLLIPTDSPQQPISPPPQQAIAPSPFTSETAPPDSTTETPDSQKASGQAFEYRPTFAGEVRPRAAVDAREHLSDSLEALDYEARRLSLTADPPTIAFRSWEESINEISKAWVLLDSQSHEAALAAVVDTIFAASHTPSITDRLLESLNPPRTLMQPLDVWRGAWRVGMLAHLSTSDVVPPVVRSRAGEQLQLALSEHKRPDATLANPFLSSVSDWLDHTAQQLAENIEHDAQSYDYWELWLRTQRHLPGARRYNRALMHAAELILRIQTDLPGSSRSANVLGRILEEADVQTSVIVRDAVLAWYTSERISGDALWAVSSILAFDALAPWFDSSFVIPADASHRVRARFRQDLLQAWPAATDMATVHHGALRVDEPVAQHWTELLAATRNLAEPQTNDARMFRLLVSARLNEAAILLSVDEPQRAARVLRSVERDLTSPQLDAARSSAPSRNVRRRSADGTWAAEYEESRRNTDEKLNLLEDLRNSRVTDLGPMDAAVFVREVYRGSPAEVRTTAHSLLNSHFRDGPTIAIELLDQFPDAARSQSNSDLIARFTGRLLPSISEADWAREARWALLQHVISLQIHEGLDIDRMAVQLSETYAEQATRLAGHRMDEHVPKRADEAAETLLDVWSIAAATVAASHGVSYGNAEMRARHQVRFRLAHGNVQRVVAAQLGMLEEMAFIVTTEQPHLRGQVNALLADAAQQRAQVEHVLMQSLQIEQTMTKLWELRFDIADSLEIQEDVG